MWVNVCTQDLPKKKKKKKKKISNSKKKKSRNKIHFCIVFPEEVGRRLPHSCCQEPQGPEPQVTNHQPAWTL